MTGRIMSHSVLDEYRPAPVKSCAFHGSRLWLGVGQILVIRSGSSFRDGRRSCRPGWKSRVQKLDTVSLSGRFPDTGLLPSPRDPSWLPGMRGLRTLQVVCYSAGMESQVSPTIGLIVLDSDRNVVAQHRSMLPARVRIETEAIELKNGIVTNASLAAMFESDQLEIAAERLAKRGVQRMLFCCTSGSLIHGPGWDQTISDRIESAAHIPASTTTTAVLAALHTVGAQTIAIGTPYIAEVDERERAFFEQAGFSVAVIEGLGCATDPEIAEITPTQIVALAQRIDRPEVDAVFLSCTTLNVADSIDQIEQLLSKPVITSNQASAWILMRALGLNTPAGKFGHLMTSRQDEQRHE